MPEISKMIVQVAITGADTVPSQSPYIPITPDEIAEECYKCWQAGAAAVHLHARDPKNGKPTGSLDIWGEVLTKVKRKCPDLIIGVTTGGFLGATIEQRISVVTTFKPEVASFTPESATMNLTKVIPRIKEFKYDWEKEYLQNTYDCVFANTFREIVYFAETMQANGTKPECEFFSTSGLYNTRALYRDGILREPLWMQFVLGAPGSTGAYPSEVLHLQTEALRIFGLDKFEWSVIGAGYPRQYTLGAMAIAMFGHVRVGMEDNIYRRPGVLAKSNVEMVEDIKTIAEICGRQLASPDEAREMLGLKGIEKVAF